MQTLARWVTLCIEVYKMMDSLLPEGIGAHSTRSEAVSVAFTRHIPVIEIYRVRMWSTIYATH